MDVMGYATSRCCVRGCPTPEKRYRFLHRFPKPNKKCKDYRIIVFKIWVYRTLNRIIYDHEEEDIKLIIKQCRVCDAHFDNSLKLPPYNKLYRGSLPTLELPDFKEEPNEINRTFAELQYCADAEEIKLFGGYKPRPNKPQEVHFYGCDYDKLKLQIPDLDNIENVDPQEIENFTQETPTQEDLSLLQSTLSTLEKPYFKSVKVYLTNGKGLSEVCRICFCTVQDSDLINLYPDDNEPQEQSKNVKEMLKEILPDLDLEIYENSVICTKCNKQLVASHELKATWSATETKLKKIIENELKNPNKKNPSLVLVAGTANPIKITPQKNNDSPKITKPAKRTYPGKKNPPQSDPQPDQILLNNFIQPPNVVSENNILSTNTVSESIDLTEKPTLIDHDYFSKPSVLKSYYSSLELSDFDFSLDQVNNFSLIENTPETNLVAPGSGDLTQTNSVNYYVSRRQLLPKGPFLCELCGCVISSRAGFKKHKKRHLSQIQKQLDLEKEAMCEFCGEICNNVPELRKHKYKKHRVEKKKPVPKFQCSICDKLLSGKKSLQMHINHIHLNIYNFVQCHLCGKQLATKMSLRAHMEGVHSDEPRHPCDICGKKFFRKISLKKHFARHTDNKVTCEICGKSVKYEATLRRHMKVFHMNEGEFNCDICGKPYWKRYDLVTHKIKKHSQQPDNDDTISKYIVKAAVGLENKYSCGICGKNVGKSGIKKHIMTHSARKVSCELCGKTVKYEETLKKHMRVFHLNEGKFNCEFCGKPYWKKFDLVSHKIKIHGWASNDTTTTVTDAINTVQT